MKRLRAALLLLTAALAGCSSPGKPLDLPDLATVGSFEVTRWEGFFLGSHVSGRYTITDRRRVADILAYLKENNKDYWHHKLLIWDTDYSVRLQPKNPDEPSIYLTFGEKWFGGTEWPTSLRERRISAAERARLVALFAPETSREQPQ